MSHGSTVRLSTTVGGDRGANGEAVLGSNTLGIVDDDWYVQLYVVVRLKSEGGKVGVISDVAKGEGRVGG